MNVPFLRRWHENKQNYGEKNTHFYSESQSGDDITGRHSKILRQIYSTASIAHQNLNSEQTRALSRAFGLQSLPSKILFSSFF